jgi:predicted  nucleic acid-binding Zn-ribbon protein
MSNSAAVEENRLQADIEQWRSELAQAQLRETTLTAKLRDAEAAAEERARLQKEVESLSEERRRHTEHLREVEEQLRAASGAVEQERAEVCEPTF